MRFGRKACATQDRYLVMSKSAHAISISGKLVLSEKNGGAPKGTRTPVSGVRGRRPRPLDDGGGAPCVHACKAGKNNRRPAIGPARSKCKQIKAPIVH